MKTKFSMMLTALLMLFCMSANAQAVKGDVNGDGVVDNADIEEVTKIITGDSTNPNGDVNGDSKVNVADIVKIADIIKNPPPANPPITFGVKIVNNTDVSVTLDGSVMFVLGNPDHNGNYLGWDGSFNHTDPIRFSGSAVTLAAGETRTFDGLVGDFMGEKSPVDPSQLEAANCPRNVVLYVNGSIENVLCDNMDTSLIFEEGGTYEIDITSAPAPTPPPTPVQSNISINLNIINQSGATVSLDGDVVFVLGNPDVYGNYYGWEGVYNRTDHLSFNTGALTLGSGESRVVTISGELGGRSPLNPALLGTAGRPRNVLLYVGGNSEIVLADNMDSNIVFQNGETYNVIITSGGSSQPTPTPTPVQSNISINLNIINQSGATVSLDGDVVFVLGNPDVYGNYYGWEGVYNRTDHLSFNTGALTLGSGESRVVTISGELGGRSPLNPALLATAGRPRNILLYVGGNSEIVLADNMDSGIVFQNGQTYNVVITSAGSSQPTPTPVPAPSASYISINLNLINASGRAVGFDGDVVFVLGNPDVYGNYYGWEGPYNRTDHLGFNTGGFTLGAGDSRVVTVTGELGGRSPLDPSWLSFAGRRSNVLLYVGGNSEIVIADNMDSGIVFQNGQTYNVVFR